MSFKRYIERLEYMDQLIRLECTGRPEVFAEKLGISKRHMYKYIECLNQMGACVVYNNKSQTYFYKEGGRLHITFDKDSSILNNG